MLLTKRKKKTNIRQECVNKSLPAMYLENLLVRFRRAINLQENVFMCYKVRGEKLIIFSNRPGLIIGKEGCNITLLKDMLQNDEACLKRFTEVELWDCDGTVPDQPWSEEEIIENLRSARWDHLEDM